MDNKFIAGLVADFDPELIHQVGYEALGYPVSLVGTFAEASTIRQALEARRT